MTCTECATPCEAFGDEPYGYVIFICPNCGQVMDHEKATFEDWGFNEKGEEYWR